MSHAGTILGITELEVERVVRHEDIKVYARPTNRPDCIHCGHAELKIKATYERTLKHTRQGYQLLSLQPRLCEKSGSKKHAFSSALRTPFLGSRFHHRAACHN
jgi:transposase